MTVADALHEAAASGLERLDAQLLLLHALDRLASDRAWLVAHDQDLLDSEAHERFAAACDRRLGGAPVAYLVGRKEFFGLDLLVDARVLVPRPETETLVSWALELLAGRAAPLVIDLGTGSGAIALAICAQRPDARVLGIDTSAGALEVARGNAQRLGLRAEFLQGSWLEGSPGGADLILSNPPYIAEGDPHLAALAHEPRQALVAGAGGLADLQAIIDQAPARLAPGGWLLLEHGWDQAGSVRELLHGAGLSHIRSRQDLAGIERCSGGQYLEQG